ncbi:MAG: hypothetical protein LBC74_07820 [Planctomycetaceae bacterium]|jgi:hypothetical protein|nr:hypothetical protein [Planctomycetaceae bacterium]
MRKSVVVFLATSFAFVCMIGGLQILNEITKGTVVSQNEIAILTGGSCLRDGLLARTVCNASCGGTIRVQVLETGETGSTSAIETCKTGYSCTYPKYSDTACSGG